jgi:hypothetical protein
MDSKPDANFSVKVGAAVIIALMLFSGAAIFLAGQSVDPTDTPSTNDNPTLSTYVVEGVKGTVTAVFSTAIVGGQTDESDKTVIDEALQQISGVKGIDSQFTQLDASSSQLTYLANVELEEGTSKEEFIQRVNSLVSLQGVEIYFQASVEIPPKMSGKNQQNEIKEFTLPQNVIQAIVTPQTMVGNQISGSVSVTFQGDTPVNAYLVESQNISLTPKSISVSGEYVLSSLEDRLSMAGSWSYIPHFSGETMKKELSVIDGVENVDEPIIPSLDTTLTLTFPDANQFVDEVNTLMQANPEKFSGVSAFDDTLRVDLNNVSLTEAKALLQTTIDETASTNVAIVFQEPLTQFLVDVNVSSGSTQMVAEKLSQYFASQNMQAEIYQNATLALDGLTDPDTNQTYPIPQGFISAVVQPGHSVNDKVFLQINAIGVPMLDGTLSYVNGVEFPPPSNPADPPQV